MTGAENLRAADGPVLFAANHTLHLDNGWSVLIYPEGELTVGGPMKSFLSGTGLLAVGS